MNPALAQLVASLLSKAFQGGLTTMYARPAQALPLDFSAAARGEDDSEREYMTYRDERGLGQTNLGRMLLPADATAFDRLERGPDRFARLREALDRGDRRYRGRPLQVGMPNPSVLAAAPGEQDVPISNDISWALRRFGQATDAGLVSGIPTPDDRDLGAAWRDTSGRLAQEARRKGNSLSFALRNPGRLDPRTSEALSRALKGVW